VTRPTSKPVNLPYQEVTEDDYAAAAAETFTVEEPKPGRRVLHGNCPRCHALIDIPIVLSVFGGNRSLTDLLKRRSEAAESAPVIEPMLCTCDEAHTGRPEGRTGCGAYWNFALRPASG
jgi:hypothetical protein